MTEPICPVRGRTFVAVPHECLSEHQITRCGRFPYELSLADLEQSFRLTPDALALAASQRTPATQLGWAVQWGTVRMLGIFQTDHPTRVPGRAVAFVADQPQILVPALPGIAPASGRGTEVLSRPLLHSGPGAPQNRLDVVADDSLERHVAEHGLPHRCDGALHVEAIGG